MSYGESNEAYQAATAPPSACYPDLAQPSYGNGETAIPTATPVQADKPSQGPAPFQVAQQAAPAPVIMMAAGPTKTCVYCQNTIAIPPGGIQSSKNERLCVSAVLCITGCWPCACCYFFCKSDEPAKVHCPKCAKVNVIGYTARMVQRVEHQAAVRVRQDGRVRIPW